MSSSTVQPTPALAPAPLPTPIGVINYLPLYVAQDGLVPALLKADINHFYLIAGYEQAWTDKDNKNHKSDHATIFRVTNTPLGLAVTPAKTDALGLKDRTGFKYNYSLPKIPWSMVTKMDTFFRAAYKKHGTEAILALAYDLTYLDSEDPRLGWMAIAPVQENTGHDCKYDPASIVDSLPDNVMLAGSAHSHPEMSAYASGTDHKDQANWDGVHITYGWKSSSRGGATEYYHEVVYAGYTWASVDLEDVMELFPPASQTEDDVADWLANVTKKTYTPTSQYNQGGHLLPKSGTAHFPTNSQGSSGSSASKIPSFSGTSVLVSQRALKYPENGPDPEKTVIIGILSELDTNPTCPHCSSPVEETEIMLHRCFGCMQFIGRSTTPIEQYNADRKEYSGKYLEQLDPATSLLPIVAMTRKAEADGKEEYYFTEDLRTPQAQKKG